MCEWRGILHAVTERGNADAVSALVELKADVNATNSESKTAAVLIQYATCLEELERGRPNADGFTPLMLEASLQNILWSFLLESTAKNMRDLNFQHLWRDGATCWR